MRTLTAVIICLAAESVPALAQSDDITDHISIDIDAQAFADYDDSDLWNNGFGGGITGLWAFSSAWHVGVRFGLDHWDFESESTIAGLVPPGAELTYSQSSGQIESLSLTPMIRYEREEVFPWGLGAFVEAGAGAAYVKTFALAEVVYDGNQTAKSEVDESRTEPEVRAMAGITHPLSSSSWIEVLASYQAILADEAVDVFGFGVGFRLRI